MNFIAACAKRVFFKVAVADICKASKVPGPGQANLWIPNVTAKFPNPDVEGISEPPTLFVNRANPPGPSSGCAANGHGPFGYDVIITPSNADVDANLPIPGLRPSRR